MDSKVFDVSKPGRAAPSPISRPVIVGQGPVIPDTSLTGDNTSIETARAEPTNTPISVSMADEEHQVNVVSGSGSSDTSSFDSGQSAMEAPADLRAQSPGQVFHSPEGATIPPHEMEELPKPNEENTGGAGANFTPLTTLLPNAGKKEEEPEDAGHHIDNLPENHSGDPGWHEAPPLPISHGAGPRRRWPKIIGWLLLLVVLVLVAGYLAIDAGLVKSDIKLPFHIFNKQKTSNAVTPAPVAKSPQPASQPPAQSATPSGFTSYKLEGTNVSFAYPTAWGIPAVTKDPGFSKRGGTNKTDGTHAYLVDFATNKDVQVALTSSKYLPATRTTLYYDFLKFCMGSVDQKYYLERLNFTTAAGVDTPTNAVCDQALLTDASILGDGIPTADRPIVQLKTKDSGGKVIGDLYTKNLTSNTDLPVLRVKDAAMKNSADIEKLLLSIKVSTSSSTTSTTP
jgi:hypothetical protein